MPPSVLLLGGHGKVARLLTPLLLSRGWNVTSVIRNPDHKDDIVSLKQKEHPGTVDVLVSSLDDVQSDAAAQEILDRVDPDYVVWSAGAGGKGGPSRTIAIDQNAAKHFISVSFASPRISKFLMVSYNGSRRNRPSWMNDDDWNAVVNTNTKLIPTYAAAKIEADQYQVARTEWRKKQSHLPQNFQSICIRPGSLTDEPGTGKVQLGKTHTVGGVPRADVATVIDRVLARDDTHGWIDLMGGDEPIDVAIERIVRDKVNALDEEDVQGMIDRYQL